MTPSSPATTPDGPRWPEADPRPSPTPWPRVLLWSLVALLPFWSLFVVQFVRGQHLGTGFICYDLAYYVANGREIFERGNGFGYCNPYDTSSDAPVIYYHWLPWLFGLGVSVLGIDPGGWFLAVGVVAGAAFAFGTFRLVEAILPAPRFLPGLFLIAMWGGGLFVLTAFVANWFLEYPLWYQLFRYDPFEGWWFLSWGRNSLFTTEATYHALVVWAWLGVVQGRPWQAVGLIAAVATTHPFSGAQHLAILGLWLTVRLATDRRFLGPWLVTGSMAAVFCGYYFLFLPQFEAHRKIFSIWSLEWIVPWGSFLTAYLPVASFAAARCWLDRRRWRPEMTFFLVAAAVSLFLIKHELFLPPKQPLHFTRGYVWMPLLLLGLPLAQRLAARVADGLPRPAVVVILTACAMLWFADNATWLVRMNLRNAEELRTTAAVFDLFRQLDRRDERGVGLVMSGEALDDNYLLGTYTRLDPYIGHIFLCPDREARIKTTSRWLKTGADDPSLEAIEVVILSKLRDYPIDFREWPIICENDRLAALRRPQ